MIETGSNLGRRRFMLVSSAAIATPLLMGVAGSTAASSATGTTAASTNLAKGTKIYFIGHGCVGCHVCMAFCPAKAVRFGDTGNEIDQKKCMHCGTCYRECPISMVSETEI
jgi:Pyruvate/2-oxoacid:ferredoxin oxidoreductase delta subunit